jgi:hypothetical protein
MGTGAQERKGFVMKEGSSFADLMNEIPPFLPDDFALTYYTYFFVLGSFRPTSRQARESN